MLCKLGTVEGGVALSVMVAEPLPLEAPGKVTDPPTPLAMAGSEAV